MSDEPVTAEELASEDPQFTVGDWEESMRWLEKHGYKIIREEEEN